MLFELIAFYLAAAYLFNVEMMFDILVLSRCAGKQTRVVWEGIPAALVSLSSYNSS
ncbi:hypothetical protein [Paenibacillus sp. NAIST15-1]|uniref:hypothetical protein n=1 Tax=Paenibacillus sp. NAIST15-1 TaxID=1605994 RepID=UPI00086967B8|nr:hypothetical protein [Paenibacillus sp. NAIST15-1]GAV13220.1 hypothetical protein PBN151_3154 [Paenibacillus sp. NAIST15-1]